MNTSPCLILILSTAAAISTLLLFHERRRRRTVTEFICRMVGNHRQGGRADEVDESCDD